MISASNIDEMDFDKIPIDKHWNTGEEKEQKIHRIHAYPAKFPAFITTKALQFITENYGIRPNKIADIFCGCGTTAFEARRNLIDFWGCDINPVATMIASTKSINYCTKWLRKYYYEIIEYFLGEKIKNAFCNANDRLKYWFYENDYNQLYHLKTAIMKTVPNKSKYQLFFMCGFSNILKPTSKWLTKSIKPQLDPQKKPQDVFITFKEQINNMIVAYEEQDMKPENKSKIVTGNFLDDNLRIPNVDLIITSPPYVTSYEYADLHQLSSLWLDFAEDYRELRKGTIGSVHHNYNFKRELKRLNSTGYKTTTLLIDRQPSKAKSVAKYFLDMQNVVQKAYSILNNNGYALFVIGNTEYKGVRINNAQHLCESFSDSGFVEIQITKRKISNKILTPYRDSKGRFSSTKSGRKIYSEEFIVLGRKYE